MDAIMSNAVKIVETISVLAHLRFAMIERLRHMYHMRGRVAFRARLAGLTAVAGAEEIRPNFGWLTDPARPAEARIGGAVKLDHLRDAFGESRDEFSVLYLISSILHLIPFPDELILWAKKNRIPVVWNQNGVAYPAWCGSFYPWFNAPMRNLIHRADYVVYQSAFCRDSADRYLGAVGAPSKILWNPVDLYRFSPSENESSSSEQRPWRLLAMGTNHAFYRVRSALDCLAALRAKGRDAHLMIAGELRWPGAEAVVGDYIQRLGLDSMVTLRGRFSQDEAPEIYRMADVLLHPKYKDPCPTVPIEAMACGVPVVGSLSGGMSELVPDSAGRLIRVVDDWNADHDPDAGQMAAAVEAIMQYHVRFSCSARQHAVQHFDRSNWVEQHREIFSGLLVAQREG